MPATLATLFIPKESTDREYLCSILECLGLTAVSSSPLLILKRVSSILQHGISIEFIPPENQFGDNQIYNQWNTWNRVISSAIRQYESRSDPKDYINDTYSYSKRAKNKAVNALFYGPSDTYQHYESSDISGLKLVLLALLMLPPNQKSQINIEKTVRLFNSFIIKLRFFPGLDLDFTSDITIDERALTCKNLIDSVFNDSTKSERQFLSALRNTLCLLQGYHLGTPKKGYSPQKKTGQSSRKSTHRKTKTIRHTPIHKPSDSLPYIGDFVEIVPDAGEQSIIGIITPETDDEDENEISEVTASAVTQIKSKFWLQNFHESTPWNSRGINPFTHSILINWIKSNDSIISLVFGLMLSIGRRFEDILNLEIGEEGDINLHGVYIREYHPPENRFKPTPEQEAFLESISNTIHLTLPDIIKNRLLARCNHSHEHQTLGHALEIDPKLLKKDTQKLIRKLIRQGAAGLALDRIHISLEKKLAQITDDEVMVHMIAGRDDDMPPVSAYYVAYSHQELQDNYRKAVEGLYR